MGVRSLPWGLTSALLATTYLRSICAASSPSINVGLKTSFSSAPYLLELLETAADENATSYYPLLDRIADGYFATVSTDKELYEQFLQILQEDAHMTDAETLSSYKFALSMRTSAPRIEAHYQYYHTAVEPSLQAEQDTSCPSWVLFNAKQYCSPTLEAAHGEVNGDLQFQELPFDRILGNPTAPASILYADITSPTFGEFHKTLVKTAREGKTSYRLRHRKALSVNSKPLMIPGYGVELALKRTDYIVIDDRDDGETMSTGDATEKKVNFEDEELADLKPLSSSELFSLGLKASSFIMQSENSFETLVKLTQDFPKYSSAIASHNATENFVSEHEYNRAQLVPGGYNIWWINGVQMIERDIEALSILDRLRAERKLINGVRDLGLTGPEAIQLLSHKEISSVQADDEPQRFDWRDESEGSNAIIWMNNIEKDKRYSDWSDTIDGMLQRVYPGQLPLVRKDCFHLVLPVDLSNSADMLVIAETLQSFVKRKLPLRIGLVPTTSTVHASDHAKVAYHLISSYGISTFLSYVERSYAKKAEAPTKSIFDAAIEGKKLREEKTAKTFEELLKSEEYSQNIEASQKWCKRLSANTEILPMFVDGVALPRDENWLQTMSQRVSTDLRAIQQGIYEETLTDETWLPQYFLFQAAKKRNSLIIPEDDKSLKVFNVNKIVSENQAFFDTLPCIKADPATAKGDWVHMMLVTDLESEDGDKLLASATVFRETYPEVELVIVHNAASNLAVSGLSKDMYALTQKGHGQNSLSVNSLTDLLSSENAAVDDVTEKEAADYWQSANSLTKSIGLAPGQTGILLNGRLVGPILEPAELGYEDLEQLLSFERSKRITPAYNALESLGLAEKISDPLAAAKVTSIVAISTINETPVGIFEHTSTIRMSQFDVWNSTHTTIEVGDITTVSVQMMVLVDPASEHGQKWIPLLKAFSEMDGVYLRMYLNPKERLQELPVKRFYRYVIDSQPTFEDDGSLKSAGATFTGVPQEALLNLGMDVPPAWLVAPKVSVHDLDNLKLSSTKANVDALYELENILIEGHSREIPGGAAPRGAQLVLGTEKNPHFADTIIMANLGYFQFKANPGFYKIDLKEGRSSDIFKIDSVGAKGWHPSPGDETTEVALMSFQGTTLYPRISRKPGMDYEDVLEAKSDSPLDFMSQGLKFAQGILGGKSKLASEKDSEQAEINIFSVASGHLYERMLNIMMVSVMNNTKHTVKFWFIEQFLSPSFKDFIPYLAAEYGFKYEMVTYKWPHWLRHQKEKQREIWGYKILFLDVLFPLSLDKVIFVDADQIVRTDMIELVNHDLKGAPYGFTPMCDSRTEMEGFRFWKQGYWERFLNGLPYHISALYVVDLHRFRQIAAGDRLRQQYHQLSADPGSLANLDQDLPNHMQSVLKIHSLPQEWLWCETWCSDESLKDAKTIDLCNNPLTKEPKLDRARRQVPEWTVYDDEIAAVDKRRKGNGNDNGNGNGKELPKEKNPKSRNFEEPPVSATTSKKDEL